MHERLLTPSLTYFLTALISRRLRPSQRPYSTLVVFDSASTALDFQSLARGNALRFLPGPSVDLVSTFWSPFLLICSTMSLDFELSNVKSWYLPFLHASLRLRIFYFPLTSPFPVLRIYILFPAVVASCLTTTHQFTRWRLNKPASLRVRCLAGAL